MTDDALTTGYEPKKVKDSKTCIDVSSDCSPINIAVHRENFNIEDDGKFEVTEHPNLFTPRALSSQRSAASTVPAFMNLDSVFCRRKPLQGYESMIKIIFEAAGNRCLAIDQS